MSRTPSEKEHAFLCMLAAGRSFEQASSSMGNDDAIRVPWECLLNGWIDQGRITKAGRELALRPCPTNRFTNTVLPPDAPALAPKGERGS